MEVAFLQIAVYIKKCIKWETLHNHHTDVKLAPDATLNICITFPDKPGEVLTGFKFDHGQDTDAPYDI
jgi:hypothetical protein